MNPSKKLRILVADDEPAVTFSILFALKNSGHLVETSSDGEEALAKIVAATEPFNLLITDNSMPRVPGLELVARLRSKKFSGKIVVLSAHLSQEIREGYEALGVDGMIPKPFDIFELRKVVDDLAASHSSCASPGC